MASSTKTCRNWLTKEDVFKLIDVKIPEELKKRRKPIVASDDIKTELKRGEREVLQKVINGEWFLANPETSKLNRDKVAKCWKHGFKLVVEKNSDEDYKYVGWLVHHARFNDGTYCGFLKRAPMNPGIRVSDAAKHFNTCKAGQPEDPKKAKSNQSTLNFGYKSHTLKKSECKKISKALRNWLNAHCREWEICDDELFGDFVESVLEVGATHGKQGHFRFDLSQNSYNSSDVARQALPNDYKEVMDFWKPLLKKAAELGLVSFYTDIGKNKKKNVVVMNVCATVSFPAIPDVTFDLVLCTESYKSLLLEANPDADINSLADDFFKKNGEKIREAFDSMLLTRFELEPEDYYIVADKAGENARAFGRRYLICFAHALDLAFKFAYERFEKDCKNSSLAFTLLAMKDVTSHANYRAHTFEWTHPETNQIYELRLQQPAKTRWLGRLHQAKSLLKIKKDLEKKGETNEDYQDFFEKIRWAMLEHWVSTCETILDAIMRSQLTKYPNLHHSVVDVLKILKTLTKKWTEPSARISTDINKWAQYLVLGVCHKCLRVFDVPHFAAFLFDPSLAYIPDLDKFIPYDKEWFQNGMAAVDYRTTDRCVKNEFNSYRPKWLQENQTIEQAVMIWISKYFEDEEVADAQVGQADDDEEDDDDFGPQFGALENLPDRHHNGASALERTILAVNAYRTHQKGYLKKTQANKQHNKSLTTKYRQDPRVFFTNEAVSAYLAAPLRKCALFVHSIKSSSASSEREFSRMGYMIAGRRGGYTPANVNKRLVTGNMLAQKRRLETTLQERKVKKSKLFHYGF